MNIVIEKWAFKVEASSTVASDVVNLVRNCSNDLSMFVYDEASILYDYFSQREVVRANMLLSKVGTAEVEEKELFVAKCADTETFVGFCFCSPMIDTTTYKKLNGTSVVMIAVVPEYRRKGVFTSIIGYLQEVYSAITLTCSPNIVDYYSKLGFEVVGSFQAQLSLTYGQPPQNGGLISIDDEVVASHHTVIDAYKNTVARHGQDAILEARSGFQQDFTQAEIEVKNYLQRYHPELA
ncbi:TPA: GNAT family N-acetyltransferase [Vibrio diabolicus]|uniref:GNAT family N-acetyltransferase n=1 Tax=Vibrio diabolicus TaxID=50719 RepID=UPI00062E6182|nr:GNAT family N-acetyltransferase [Vibrio diabolicus]KLE23396.1 hypothetical protein AAW52_17205 [Vibrio diabolicus]MCR9303317.1 GNAT family N-acetyltransferase [Vibrio diabolicus]MCR9426914.1 GNAT family N-acetyltransferase [Vibrio diabolicus]MCS0312480.1 GNAT family N-acetyltransferase [Vibrio diabolicus]MCS0319518.1 GNAT family N-acetyltransferase [Vibrio diabolicus]